jgi:exodeoxyribonuclease VII large subunit
VVAALNKLERYPGLDVIIIGRGGGSGEDLMAFNDESVVRRVASTRVPVVSAVGHEVDISLTDFVADVRAATPSEAAELVVPDRLSRVRAFEGQVKHLNRAMRSKLNSCHNEAERLHTKLGDPRYYLAERQQQLDELRQELTLAMERGLRLRQREFEQLQGRVLLQHPKAVLARARASLFPLDAAIASAMRMRLGSSRAMLNERFARIEALSPLAILSRGYAIVTNLHAQVVSDTSQVRLGERLHVRLHRGRLSTDVIEREPCREEVIP